MSYQFDKGIEPTYTPPRIMRWVHIILSASFLIPASAIAQTDGSKAAIQKPASKAGSANAKGQVEAAIAAKAAKLSFEEKKKRSDAMLGDMRKARLHALGLLNEARSSKDIMRLNCVNEKLTQIKGLLKIGEKASLKMFEEFAAAKPEDKTLNFQYSTLAVAYQRTLVRRTEADKCVGEATVYSGETEVEVTVDDGPGLGTSDPTVNPAPYSAPVVPSVASGS